MAKQLYKNVAGGSQTSFPPGLECIGTAGVTLLLAVSDPDDPDNVLAVTSHDDVIVHNTIKGRLVAGLLVKLLNATWNGSVSGGVWQLHIEYDETALVTEELDQCDIQQAICFDTMAQAFSVMAAWVAGDVDPEWLTSYEAHLDAYPDIDPGDLTVLPAA